MKRLLAGPRTARPTRRLVAAVAGVLALLLSGCATTLHTSAPVGSAQHHTKGQYTIALSNAFLGNSWRQTMVKVFQDTADRAKKQGWVSGSKVENTSQNTATEQIAQMKALILQGVDAILVDSASPTALNPTITQACKAGIVVVVFDSLASAPCEYNLSDDMASYGRTEAQSVAEGMHGHGNVIISRGLVGSGPEKTIYDNQRRTLARYPRIHVSATVVGQSSDSVTEQAVQNVLPSLGRVDGVLTGGSSQGAVQGFQNAHRPVPQVAFENTGESLRLWKSLHDRSGYRASSVRSEPGQVAAAFWTALQVLQGHKVPQNIDLPILKIDQAHLDDWLRVTPDGSVATWMWSRRETLAEIAAQGRTLPTPPIPARAP